MKRVVAYCRVSTDAQAGEDRFGIESQKQTIMAYCRSNDAVVTDWYIDEGESGVKESRPALDELLYGDIKNPPIEAVIVAKSDRIARDIKLYFYYLMLLKKKGIDLISATEAVVNDETGLGSVYKALMLFVAEQERMNITKRTLGGRITKAKSGGRACGRSPYGYAAQDGMLVIVPEEAEVIRKIFKARSEGETMRGICEMLNKEGIKTKRGSAFLPSTLQIYFENEPLYRGMTRFGKKSEWVKGQHEPILTDE